MCPPRILQRQTCFVSWSISTRLAIPLSCTVHLMRCGNTAAALRYSRRNTSGVTPNGKSTRPARGLVRGARPAVRTPAADGARGTDSEVLHTGQLRTDRAQRTQVILRDTVTGVAVTASTAGAAPSSPRPGPTSPRSSASVIITPSQLVPDNQYLLRANCCGCPRTQNGWTVEVRGASKADTDVLPSAEMVLGFQRDGDGRVGG